MARCRGFPDGKVFPPARCRDCVKTRRYRRLHAAWRFSLSLTSKWEKPVDTIGFSRMELQFQPPAHRFFQSIRPKLNLRRLKVGGIRKVSWLVIRRKLKRPCGSEAGGIQSV